MLMCKLPVNVHALCCDVTCYESSWTSIIFCKQIPFCLSNLNHGGQRHSSVKFKLCIRRLRYEL